MKMEENSPGARWISTAPSHFHMLHVYIYMVSASVYNVLPGFKTVSNHKMFLFHMFKCVFTCFDGVLQFPVIFPNDIT